jgi:L-asparaginase/beta-aspartyl-peptidase (threonine type)
MLDDRRPDPGGRGEMTTSLVVTHGGVSAPPATLDGCMRAAERGAGHLAAGDSAIAAAVAAVETLESDGRFCAGAGSSIRLDGHTVEMDAALHASTGLFAGVAALRDAPHPIRVVERLLGTPARFLAGEGARRFAERHGLTAPFAPTARARALFARVAGRAAAGRLHEEYAAWRGVDLAANWNFERPVPDYAKLAAAGGAEDLEGTGGACDTVGVVIRDVAGTDREGGRPRFVAAVSTGGTAAMLMGRVGDSPLPGCGLYAGPAGAVTVTGEGEEIIRHMLSRWIYDRLAFGVEPERACREGVALFPKGIHVGAIAVGVEGHGHAASDEMPVASAEPRR